jgi:hypothetical protein
LTRTSELIALLREVANAHSASPSQIALAWVIHRHAVAAIAGASSVEQLESNVAAADIKLADDEYQALRQASARICPTVDQQEAPNGDMPESRHSTRFALKHSAKGGWYVAKTIWRDRRPQRAH